MKPTPVPLVTAAMVAPFTIAVAKAGRDPGPLLDKLGLETADLADPEKFIPGQAWYDLAEAAATQLRDPHLGFAIGAKAAFESLPNLHVLHLPHATLGELLHALVIDAPRISSLATYRVSADSETARLETRRNFRPVTTPAQVDGYFAGFMLRILQLCTGPAWDAARVSVTVSDPAAVPGTELEARINRDPDLRGAQFAFPAVWLLHRTDGASRQALHAQPEPAAAFLDTIRTLLERHLDQPGLTLQRFALLTGFSAGKLKRTLAEHGTSYARERDQLRAARARMLLATTREEVARIGTRVGHPDAPGFTRSFRRWTGQTPRSWRLQNQLAEQR